MPIDYDSAALGNIILVSRCLRPPWVIYIVDNYVNIAVVSDLHKKTEIKLSALA